VNKKETGNFLHINYISLNVADIQYSYNLLKPFPDNLESREGFEILEGKFSPGSLAPTTVLLTSDSHHKNNNLLERKKPIFLTFTKFYIYYILNIEYITITVLRR